MSYITAINIIAAMLIHKTIIRNKDTKVSSIVTIFLSLLGVFFILEYIFTPLFLKLGGI